MPSGRPVSLKDFGLSPTEVVGLTGLEVRIVSLPCSEEQRGGVAVPPYTGPNDAFWASIGAALQWQSVALLGGPAVAGPPVAG